VTLRCRDDLLKSGAVVLRHMALRYELVAHIVGDGVVVVSDAVGQFNPCLGHPEQEKPAVRVSRLPRHLYAISGVKTVNRSVFSVDHPTSPVMSFDIPYKPLSVLWFRP
jgi:hypothetical protein